MQKYGYIDGLSLVMDDLLPGDNADRATMWEVGVFDAHCHPTDIMASIDNIPKMKARILTVMATRLQDQDLVARAASVYSLPSRERLRNLGSEERYIVPAFGWHPWFSHQIYDDGGGGGGGDGEEPTNIEHYKAVLTPTPTPEDEEFLHTLPQPRPLSRFLAETEKRLEEYPLALVGEVGIDKAFRLPHGPHRSPQDLVKREPALRDQIGMTPGSREGRPLSPYRVSLNHQKMILKAQLQLAGKMDRPVSVHSVQAHGAVFEILQSLWAGHEKMSKRERKRRKSATGAHDAEEEDVQKSKTTKSESNPPRSSLPYPPRICMHSYSGPADPLRQFLNPCVPAEVYFSFSHLVNFSNASSQKATQVIGALPDDRILAESDLHCAGEQMDDLLEDIVRRICSIKKWSLKEGAEKLRANWERFIFGE